MNVHLNIQLAINLVNFQSPQIYTDIGNAGIAWMVCSVAGDDLKMFNITSIDPINHDYLGISL